MFANEDYLIDLLKESGFLEDSQLEQVQEKKLRGETPAETIVRLGFVSSEDVSRTRANSAQMEYIDLSAFSAPPEIVETVAADVAQRYKVVPVGVEAGRLRLAVSDPHDFETLDSLPHVIPHDIEFVCSTPESINDVLIQFYGDAEQLARTMERQLMGNDEFSGAEEEQGEAETEDAPIIRMVSSTLFEAFKVGASDIHIEPLERDLRIRYRIDGVLHDVEHHPKKLHNAVISRIKIMTGKMNIDDKRTPQDGRIEVNVGGKRLDLRVSTIPSNHGESVVMRILDKESLKLGLSDLGFFSDDEEAFNNLIALPDGIILVTGPTGSGKTTTLYACLNTINKPDKKIITVEDPVEYELNGINQVMVKEAIGMTFAAALRSMLRQAPNIIMIGEIRDNETAQIAINASLTGHLVFSTLHTNDAPSAIARLVNIGIKPFLVASALRAIVAQRLVRKLCAECKKSGMMTEKEMRALNLSIDQLGDAMIMAPVGCDKCRSTGFKGRMGIIEIFKIDDEARHMINENLSTPRLRSRARELGMRTLREDGIRKALAGNTTAAEILRATMGDNG